MFKVGDKFVIEIESVYEQTEPRSEITKKLYRMKGFNTLIFDNYGMSLLEPAETNDDAYKRGWSDAIESVMKKISEHK